MKADRKHSETAKRNIDVYSKAFDLLINEIRDDFDQGAAFDTTTLLEKYKSFLAELRVPETSSYRTEKLKARLQKHYGKNIAFHSGSRKNEPELVYNSSVDVRATVNKITSMKKQASEEAI